MSLHLEPLHPLFAAEASGIDLTQPVDAATVRAVDDAMNKYAVVVFRGQPLTEDQQVAFAGSFGTLDAGLKKLYPGAPTRFRHEATIDISNVRPEGGLHGASDRKSISNFANQLWHSDSSFQRPAAKYSMLHAVVVPSKGGDTEYVDLRAAYDALPDDLKQEIEHLHSVHAALHSRIWLGDKPSEAELAKMPPVQWPLVRTHAGSGRKLLWVGVHATHIVEKAVAEGRMLLLELLEHATQREFIYRHEWRVGDLVIWDNRATIHRGKRFDITQPRELRRTTTNDEESLNDSIYASMSAQAA
jgi:alpha-ketoglutarate-dependent 2,4-dichlorophenoxyacetate dioxygenase